MSTYTTQKREQDRLLKPGYYVCKDAIAYHGPYDTQEEADKVAQRKNVERIREAK